MVPRRPPELGDPNSLVGPHPMRVPLSIASPAAARPSTIDRRWAGLLLGIAVLAACIVASLAVGSRSTSLGEVLGAFTAYDGSDAHAIVRELRVPRTELGLMVGAALGAAGALMQGVTRNALAEPGILGLNAGAAFAVVLAISLLGVSSVTAYAAFALAGAGLTAALVFALG